MPHLHGPIENLAPVAGPWGSIDPIASSSAGWMDEIYKVRAGVISRG